MINSETELDEIISEYDLAEISIESIQIKYSKGDKTVNNLIDKLFRVGFKAGVDWKEYGQEAATVREDYISTDEAIRELQITHGNGNENLNVAIKHAYHEGVCDGMQWWGEQQN